jgi:hypothetical protein
MVCIHAEKPSSMKSRQVQYPSFSGAIFRTWRSSNKIICGPATYRCVQARGNSHEQGQSTTNLLVAIRAESENQTAYSSNMICGKGTAERRTQVSRGPHFVL